MKKRIILSIIIFTATVWLPWYITAPLLLFGFFAYAPYYEGLFFVFLYDALYGSFGEGQFLFWSLIGLCIFAIAYVAKPLLRDHD
jgi:hypothetical protein